MSKRKTVLPGHMKKAIERVEELAATVDLAIEVVDARAPHASRCPILTRILAGPHHVTILSKTDLADPAATRAWKTALADQGRIAAELPFGKNAKPGALLSSLDIPFYGEPGRMIKALIIGIPNVGKSTLINILAGNRRAHTGAKPGITRGLQLVKLPGGVFLYDTPGVINPVIRNEEQAHILGLIGCLQENMFDTQAAATYLAQRVIAGGYTGLFAKTYQMDPPDTAEPLDLIGSLARRRGCVQRGGEADLERACNILLRDFSTGRFRGLTLETPDQFQEE
jgi:ribosome biogenesis GTPase A